VLRVASCILGVEPKLYSRKRMAQPSRSDFSILQEE
jgi:hypothetical protein